MTKLVKELLAKLYEFIKFILDWKTLLCYIPVWFVFSGWTYVAIAFGSPWIRAFGSAWLAMLWMPWCPEKLITIPITLWIKRIIFKKENLYMATENIKVVKKTFQDIADTVTPTMGAKGRMAVINDEFGRPILTDDGVTVAKNIRDSYEGFERMVAISMIEAASNTERHAYDGTTLTVLLTNELYKQGLKWIKHGMHPQIAADKIAELVGKVREALHENKYFITDKKEVKELAYITTKIPVIGDLVTEAYKHAGKNMNVIMEHERKETESSIEHTEGMILDAGYFADVMQKLCNQGDKTIFEGAYVSLLAEGILTGAQMRDMFLSIPKEAREMPFVFIVASSFNPESLRMLTDTLINNQFKFQFIFINDKSAMEIFLDLEAKTGAIIQDPSRGTSDYMFDYMGLVDSITIERDKTIIISEGNEEALKERIEKYNKELDDDKFVMSQIRYNVINRRLANITTGVTKIKIACPTITEYQTIKLKLDDAIGAVKCALRDGILLGGGKALYNLSNEFKELKTVLQAPLFTICKNAGLKHISTRDLNKFKYCSYDVNTGDFVNLTTNGIMDSFTSIDSALNNAASIAVQYLRAFVLIKK
jgi:chaperonin GroEL